MFKKKDKKSKDNNIPELNPQPTVDPNKVSAERHGLTSKALWGVSLEEAARRSDPRWIIASPIQFVYDYLTSNEKCLGTVCSTT